MRQDLQDQAAFEQEATVDPDLDAGVGSCSSQRTPSARGEDERHSKSRCDPDIAHRALGDIMAQLL